jgi:hypothetical protein
MSLFASVFLYAGQKLHELMHPDVQWNDVLSAWRRKPALCPWEGMRTIARARELGEEVFEYTAAGSLITKARSRAAGFFLRSPADVWLTVDDDAGAELDVLERLVRRARETRGIVSAPCLLRGQTWGRSAKLNIGMDPGARVEGDLAPLLRTGMGLVALHRQAILDVASMVPLVTTDTEGSADYPALFLEEVRTGEWIGDDYAFSDRAVAAGVPLFALLNAPTVHARLRGMLREDLAVIVDEATAAGRFARDE